MRRGAARETSKHASDLGGRSASLRARRLARELAALGRPKPGFDLRSYLGSPLPTLAVPIPELRRLARGEALVLRSAPAAGRRKLLEALWDGATIDERLLAIEFLEASPDLHDEPTWRMVDRWADRADRLVPDGQHRSGPVSALLDADPRRYQALRRWTRSPNLWRRRIVLYAMRRDVHRQDLDRPFEVFDLLLHRPEFFVQRAVGTWLRECWKVDARRTERYLWSRSPASRGSSSRSRRNTHRHRSENASGR